MEQAKTHLGTKELHKRHSVMIEGGMVPRARVMDQHIIDRYLMNGWLTLSQHRAGEVLLGQAATAGIWPRGIDLSSVTGGGRPGKPNYVPFGAIPFGRMINYIAERLTNHHARLTREVICANADVSGRDEGRLLMLTDSLDVIANRYVAPRAFQRFVEAKKRDA